MVMTDVGHANLSHSAPKTTNILPNHHCKPRINDRTVSITCMWLTLGSLNVVCSTASGHAVGEMSCRKRLCNKRACRSVTCGISNNRWYKNCEDDRSSA